MNDKELLELAAKAAGIVGVYEEENRMIREFVFQTRRHIRTANGLIWNPLDDDSDALRLAVKLDLLVDPMRQSVTVTCDGFTKDKPFQATEPCGSDLYAATRRAIVRAAAEIGIRMQTLQS